MSERELPKALDQLSESVVVPGTDQTSAALEVVGVTLQPGMVFVQTKEYRRFVELCEECRRSHLIGLCYGAAGVGKTEAGRAYAHWDEIQPLLSWYGVVQPRLSPENPRPQTAFYTPTATVTVRQIERDLALLRWSLRVIGEAARAVPQEVETREGLVRPGQARR